MRIDIITVLPEIIDGALNCSILKRAQDKGLVEIVVHNLRDYSTDKHRRGRLSFCEAGWFCRLSRSIEQISQLKSQRHYDEVIYTSPDGEPFTQRIATNCR